MARRAAPHAAKRTRAVRGRSRAADRGASALRAQLKKAQEQVARHEYLLSELSIHREELQTQNEALIRAERELWLARDSLSDLFELAPMPYLTLTRAGMISAINLRGGVYLGQDAVTLVGKPFALFVTPAERPRFRRHLINCRRSREMCTIELTLLTASGPAPAQLFSNVRTSDRIYTAVADLRERRRAADERRELAVKAEAARASSEAKDQFLATLSHELRTPLTPVLAAITSLERTCGDRGVNAGELFATVRRNLRYEVRLIDDLLDVERLSHGKLPLESQVVDLHAVVTEAVDQVRVDADGKGVALTLDLVATQHHVGGDPDRLRQVFGNLLRNAIKFTPGGGRVTVLSRDQAKSVLVAVRDTGVGIPPADRERIFERFAQGTGARPRDGLGLGLSIAHGIVTAHGGRIEVRSGKQDQGATFEVRLQPVAAPRSQPSPPAPPPAPDNGHPAPPAARRKRILFVEDHQDTALMMAAILEGEGYEVTLADSVQSALSHAEDPVDLVVSDIGLPDGSGLDLMRALCARRPLPGIALSGYGTSEDIDRSHAAGFQRHLTKPVEVPELLRAIERLRPPAAAKVARSRRRSPARSPLR